MITIQNQYASSNLKKAPRIIGVITAHLEEVHNHKKVQRWWAKEHLLRPYYNADGHLKEAKKQEKLGKKNKNTK